MQLRNTIIAAILGVVAVNAMMPSKDASVKLETRPDFRPVEAKPVPEVKPLADAPIVKSVPNFNKVQEPKAKGKGAAQAVKSDVYFKTCSAARAAGYSNMLEGEPGYARHLDRDGDGIACERN